MRRALALGVSAVLVTGHAHAQTADEPEVPVEQQPSATTPPSPADVDRLERAKRLYDAANAALDAGDIEKALALFRASQGEATSRYNVQGIAFCLYELGRFDEAADAYHDLTRRHFASVPPEVAAAMDTRREELAGKVASLRVDGPAGAAVILDGRSRGMLPSEEPIHLMPGQHVVRIMRGNSVLVERNITVVAGEAIVVEAPLPGVAPDPAPTRALTPPLSAPDPAVAEGGPPAAWVAGWIATAVGVAVLGAGAYFGIRAIAKGNESNDLLDNGRCYDLCFEAWEDGQRSATAANVALIAGAVTTATGVTLVIVGGAEPRAAGAKSAHVTASWRW